MIGVLGRGHQVAFVLTGLVVEDDDELPAPEAGDGFPDPFQLARSLPSGTC